MIPMILYIAACVLLCFVVFRTWRKVKAPRQYLNSDPWYWCRGFLPHRELYTWEQRRDARERSKRVRREQCQIWNRHVSPFIAVLFWAPKAALSFVFAGLTWLLAPVVVLFAEEDENGLGWLPSWLWWFQTPDNPVDGEPFWIEAHPNKYRRRVGWLWRNAGYGFDWNVLSPRIPKTFTLKTWGNPATGNLPLVNGVVLRYIQGSNPFNTIWQFYYVRAWSKTRCIRINLGYKIWSNPQPGKVAQIVCSPTPCMGYTTQ